MTNVTSGHTGEKQEKWEPVEGIATPAASALVVEDSDGLIVTLLFSEIVDGGDYDLRLRFGRVLAYTVYDEFAHPWETSEAAPTLNGRWGTYSYPLLQIRDSRWIASLPNFSTIHPHSTHYRFLTLDKIIDVLCSRAPEVGWVSSPRAD